MAMHGFQKLVDDCYAKVFYHCIKKVRNDHDAADITQNTFFKAFLQYGSLRNAESAEPWLFTICNNEIKQFYRNQAKQILDIMPRESTDEDEETEKAEELYTAIDQLSDAQRQIILLKYFGGYTMQELTIALSISIATVKSRLYEARQAVKKIMDTTSKQSKRRRKIMSIINLCEVGAETIPCLSLYAQQQLLNSAKENTKFAADVLSELAKIPAGQKFLEASNGKLSYDEFVKILACCDEAVLYRIIGRPYYDWRSAPDNPLVRDIAALREHGGYIDSVETILCVPSLRDTCHWYKKYLGWNYGDNDEDNENWGHAAIRPYANNELQSQYKGFNGFHLRSCCDKNPPTTNAGCFVFVSGLEALRESIIERGLDKISEIWKAPWGTNCFKITDLNGFSIEFCEWRCE